MRSFLSLSLFLLLVLSNGGCTPSFSKPSSQQPATAVEPDDDLGPVGDFSFTERSGQAITRADLRGKVWIASFIFTRCCTGCPQVASTLAQLQKELPPEVVLVSFSVDPEHDTPETLKEYADQFAADSKRWLFLTGKQDDIYRLIRDSFLLGVEQNVGSARTPGNEVTHSTRLMLVDRHGRIRGAGFDGTNAEELSGLRQKIDALLREDP